MSRTNGSLVAKGSCNLVVATAGLSAATAVAKAWREEAMAVFLVVHISRYYRGSECGDGGCQSLESGVNGGVANISCYWSSR